jgi:uncharacterized membrane protein YedE/YeeE
MDAIFNAWIVVVGYGFIVGVMATIVVFETCLTIFEQLDML